LADHPQATARNFLRGKLPEDRPIKALAGIAATAGVHEPAKLLERARTVAKRLIDAGQDADGAVANRDKLRALAGRELTKAAELAGVGDRLGRWERTH
jgi:hypothetical protein